MEFWALTPRETYAAIDAANWRTQWQQKRDVALAWHIAALTRARNLPSLQQLLCLGETRVLEGEELERRRAEHAAMISGLNMEKLTHGRH